MEKGYCLTAGSKLYFMATPTTRKTKKVVNEFIDKLGHYRGMCDARIEECKVQLFDYVQYGMSACTVEVRTTCTTQYYHIEGNNFIENIPFADAECIIIL